MPTTRYADIRPSQQAGIADSGKLKFSATDLFVTSKGSENPVNPPNLLTFFISQTLPLKDSMPITLGI